MAQQVSKIDPRYRSLDLWRGLACLMVVIDHVAVPLFLHSDVEGFSGADGCLRRLVWGLTRMGLGPPMFFVISGYCIAASVDSLRRKGKSGFEFLARRVWRTYPPYWAAILFFVGVTSSLDLLGQTWLHQSLYGYSLDSPGELTQAQWLGNLTLTETWRPRVFPGVPAQIFTRVAWSLCYQEQFYFVCFLAVMLAPRRLYGMLAAVTAATVAYRVMLWDSGSLRYIDGTFLYYWHEFAVGLAVYWRLNAASNRTERHTIDLLLLAMMTIATMMRLESTAIAAGAGLVMIGLRRWDAPLAELPRLGWLRACGRRCYSIYLVHLPIASVLCVGVCSLAESGFWPRAMLLMPAAVGLSVAGGCLFYRLVESRFLDLPGRAARKAAPVRTATPAPMPRIAA